MDLEYGRIALSLGFISTDQLSECLQSQNQKKSTGEHILLSTILLQKHYISSQQNNIIQQKMVKKGVSQQAIPQQRPQQIPQQKLGRYVVQQEIGRGGMGVVYQAYDSQLDRILALKCLLPIATTEISQKRFLREAKATAKLQHPNIITVHDIGFQDGTYFFTMDYIEGKSLQEICAKSPSIRQCVEYLSKICEAIHYAHQQGIVHRDLKPSNVMIDLNNQPIVMDFGLAKVAGSNSKLSKSGAMLGTLFYMSPEQAEGKVREINHLSDVYSLGVILYEMLVGRPPFIGKSFTQVMNEIIHRHPVYPREIKPRIPKSIEAICLKALQKNPSHRYSSAKEFAEDLQRFLRKEPVLAEHRKVSGKVITMIAVAMLLLVTMTVLFMIFDNPKPPEKIASPEKIDKNQEPRVKNQVSRCQDAQEPRVTILCNYC